MIPLLTSMPAMFCVAVLTGEEIPDLLPEARRASTLTPTPSSATVNRYHRQEEARHIAFARMILPELLEESELRRPDDGQARCASHRRWDVRLDGEPRCLQGRGSPGWKTWLAANRTPQRLEIKHGALRPLLAAVIDAGGFPPGEFLLHGDEYAESTDTGNLHDRSESSTGTNSISLRESSRKVSALDVRFSKLRSSASHARATEPPRSRASRRDAGLSATGIYPYFPNKEALFVAAVDEDAAGEIEEALAGVRPDDLIGDWRHVIVGFLKRSSTIRWRGACLQAWNPKFTVRLIGIPALDQLRKDLGENLEGLQLSGAVRDDIDARAMANGFMTIWLSLLMSLVQTGSSPVELLGEEVVAVFDAVMRPVRPQLNSLS